MQGYSDGPPGDNFSRACGEDSNTRRFPPLPPGWAQHAGLTKVKLLPFWTKDTRSWFKLAESTFNRSHVADTRLRFDLVLPALPEEVIEQVRSILHAVDNIADPYRALKAKLLDLFTPSRWISARGLSSAVSLAIEDTAG